MVIVIRKAVRGSGFDIHAPEGYEDADQYNVDTLENANVQAQALAERIEAEGNDRPEISDESMYPTI